MGSKPIEKVIVLSRSVSAIGGLILCVLTLMIVISIIGRALVGAGLGPVPGDYELVELGTAIAVFSFLPWCYLKSGHATVDLFYAHFPRCVKWMIDTLSDLAMLVFWFAITWMLYQAMLDKISNGETTFTLQIPIWWAYAFSLAAALIGCLAHIAHTLIQLGLASWPKNWKSYTSEEH